MKKIEAHQYADLFPMMTPTELESLTADVAEFGLRTSIVRYQGLILDGRNRLLACQKAEVEPTFTDFEGSEEEALALVISLNVQRRDLTGAQRAIVAAKAANATEGRPKKTGINNTSFTNETAAKTFKAGVLQVKQAKALLADASDLAAQVESCTLSLAAAYEELQERRKAAKQKTKDSQRVAEYADAISSGEMKLEEALQKAIEQERVEKERQEAEADARRRWLTRFSEFRLWVENFVSKDTDEYLASYTIPGSPGFFDHGNTFDNVDEMIEHLVRVRDITFGGDHGKKRKRS